MKRLYCSLFLVLTSVCLTAHAQKAVRQRINFDDGWRFHLGNAADPLKDFNFKIANIFSKTGKADQTAIDTKFNDSAWRALDLPHDWAVELPFVKSGNFDVMSHGYKPVGGLYPETSIGWYRKHFDIAKSDSGQRFSITFDGIYRDAKVWLNGIYVGTNESGYVGITYDITDYVNFDKENVLVVRADASQYEGWFYEGAGIYRHVWLNQFNNLHIQDKGLFVYADVKGITAMVSLETSIENQSPASSNATVAAYIADRNGRKLTAVLEMPVALKADGTATVKQQFKITNPRLWNLDDPYLYRVVSMVKQNGKVVDSMRERFGVRTLAMDAAKGFSLNGRHIKIKGTNNHQDAAGVGSALPDNLQYYRIGLLKELGANAYRASHHSPTPELLEACDSLGMLVIDEQRLLNSSPEYMNQLERMIKRDRNHPSVFMWSIGNEEGSIQTESSGKRIAQTLIARQHELDPTRTCTYAADLANVYAGVNEAIPVRGFNYRQFAVAAYHKDHPAQPVIGTEMGSTVTTRGIYKTDSVKGYLPDQDLIAPWWASRAEEWWVLAAQNPYWLGGFVWTGFDYRGEPTPFEWPNINSHFGIMDVCGFPKNLYYYYQSWWTDKDVLHISPHWNWKGKEGQPIDVWVNSNADNVELFLNGKSLGKKDMPRNRHLQWSVLYEPGTLEAVAYKGNRKLTSKVETTGEPFKIVVSPDRKMLQSDGKDIAILNISVVDRQGREVPTAGNLIKYHLTGDAKIIGVGNGDPSSAEPDKYFDDNNWQRCLFNGKCQVTLQAGKSNDAMIMFGATSVGLEQGSAGIQYNSPRSSTLAKGN